MSRVWTPAAGAEALVHRVGVLSPSYSSEDDFIIRPFYDEMGRLGWIEGRNVAYDRAYGNDHMELMPRLAADLVARRPELIVAFGPTLAAAAKQATSTIPIVFAVVVDPLSAGLVASLAHPGGNVTGVTQSIAESLAPKRIGLLREIMPGVRHIGLLGNTLDPGSVTDQAALAPLSGPLGMTLTVANATNVAQFDASVIKLIDQKVQAILVANGIAVGRRKQMIALASRARIPVVGFNETMADAGALFSFGPSIVDQIARSAHLVDKILHDARPADIPVEAGDRLQLVVNARTARELGLTIPQSFLLRADRVID